MSEDEGIRSIRKPVLDKKKVRELAHASVDKRYYSSKASRLGENFIAHWYGRERWKNYEEYKLDVTTVREMKPLIPFCYFGIEPRDPIR